MYLKSNKLVSVVSILFLFIIESESRGTHGGLSCGVCTVVTGIIQGEAHLKGISIHNAANNYCMKWPATIQPICLTTVEKLAELLTDTQVLDNFSPDTFCYAIHACIPEEGSSCHLFPLPDTSTKISHEKLSAKMNEHGVYGLLQRTKRLPSLDEISIDFCNLPLLKQVCDVFSETFDYLMPAVDLDNDGFSIVNTLRGSNWRGKDCNDVDSSIYPGAQIKSFDSESDSNCNGISGVDAETGKSWEDILCGETNSKGLIYIGDSYGAHFHYPEVWMNPSIESESSYTMIIGALLDSLDWPELGFATGFVNTTYPNLIEGTTDSIYLRLRDHNRCMHRDYQNMARNGADSANSMQQIEAVTRTPSDKPAIVIYAMMGNDVCNGFKETIGNITKPNDFRDFVMEALTALDQKLPPNSDVVLISLLDAGIVYDNMASRVHPLGSVMNNVRYDDMYTWFNCMEIGPCYGWLNSNATLRNITSQKALELSSILKNIATNKTFKSFKLHYLENPFNTVVDRWIVAGKNLYELVDPIDSTHPTQLAQPLIAAELWESLKSIGVLGEKNPHNEKIIKLFGEQGGH